MFYTIKDCDSHSICVPCGVCEECAAMRQTEILQRAELASIDHDVYYGTLTYNNKAIPHTRVFRHLDGRVRDYIYADPDDFRRMMQRIRKENFHNSVNIRYIMVTEYGGRFHRPHIHFLLFVPKQEFDFWYTTTSKDSITGETILHHHSGHYCPGEKWNEINFSHIFFHVFLSQWKRNISKSTKYPVWLPLCTYIVGRDGRSTYDFHYVEPFTKNGKDFSNVANYVTKYILKFDKWLERVKNGIYNNLSPEDYAELWKLLRPKVRISLLLGSDNPDYVVHIRKGIEAGKKGINGKYMPFFIDLNNGKYMPLGRYLRKKFYTFDDALKTVTNNKLTVGLTEWDDFSELVRLSPSRSLKNLENNNKAWLEKELARYDRVFRYLEDCNNSDTILDYVDDNDDVLNFLNHGLPEDLRKTIPYASLGSSRDFDPGGFDN